MDDLLRRISLLFIATFSIATARANEISLEYVSPQRKLDLERDFANARFSQSDRDSAQNRVWNCEMVGVRSRMQVQRDLKLYKLVMLPGSNALNNSGSHIIRKYEFKDNALIGQNERFEDQVRMTSDGRLIAKLTALKPQTMVISYSVCRSL